MSMLSRLVDWLDVVLTATPLTFLVCAVVGMVWPGEEK